jgi:predicted SprT family Zn-dependent metalloprotease
MHLGTLKAGVKKHVEYHMSKMGLDNITFEILRKREMPKFKWGCEGLAYCSENRIVLQREYLETEWKNQDKVEDLIIHELMHIFVNKKYGPYVASHGKEFRRACVAYGIHPAVSGYKRILEESRGISQ